MEEGIAIQLGHKFESIQFDGTESRAKKEKNRDNSLRFECDEMEDVMERMNAIGSLHKSMQGTLFEQ